jgi:hypothetical protein
MAKGGKVKTTFSYNKLSRKLAGTITNGINQLGKQVNINIGKNLASGKGKQATSYIRKTRAKKN